jgi:Fe2+ transport system protein B
VIPNIAVLEIQSPHWRMPRLWIPLIFLWIPLAVFLLLLSPLLVIVILAISMVSGVGPWRVTRIFWDILSSLPGTHVHVTANKNKVLVRIL